MIARVMKTEIRKRHRNFMRKSGVPLEVPYIKIIVDYLNEVLFAPTRFYRFLNDINIK